MEISLIVEFPGGKMNSDPELQYTRTPARYAKGMIALRIPGIDGWKSVAALVLDGEIAPNARFSNREKCYIVSPRQADRFEASIEALRIKREQHGNS
jgi:hypothetical protein